MTPVSQQLPTAALRESHDSRLVPVLAQVTELRDNFEIFWVRINLKSNPDGPIFVKGVVV